MNKAIRPTGQTSLPCVVKPIDIDVLERKLKAALAGGEPPKEQEKLLQEKDKVREGGDAANH